MDDAPILLAGCGAPAMGALVDPLLGLRTSQRPVDLLPSMGYEITLRYFYPDTNMVEVIEMTASTSAVPRVGSIRRMQPTAADLAFVAALREHNIVMVNVDGEAAE